MRWGQLGWCRDVISEVKNWSLNVVVTTNIFKNIIYLIVRVVLYTFNENVCWLCPDSNVFLLCNIISGVIANYYFVNPTFILSVSKWCFWAWGVLDLLTRILSFSLWPHYVRGLKKMHDTFYCVASHRHLCLPILVRIMLSFTPV